MENPFDIVVYDKTFTPTGFVTNPSNAFFNVAWRGRGFGNFTLPATHPYSEQLQAEGARVTVQYRGADLMSGRVTGRQGGLTARTDVVYQFVDDSALLDLVHGFPVPANLVTAQTADYYAWGSPASVEAAVRQILVANMVTRLGLPVTAATSLGRGGTPTLPQVRFTLLREVVEPLLDQGNLGLIIRQPRLGTSIGVSMRTPVVWPQTLTVESGIVNGDGTYTVTGPTATRVIVGGPGEMTARTFYATTQKTTRTTLENLWGFVGEVFRDATSSDTTTEFQAEEAKALTEGQPTTGLSLTLSETERFHFGGTDGIQLGDQVTILVQDQPLTDRITEAELSFNANDGLTVTPYVGERKDDPSRDLAQAISNISRAQRRMTTAK